MAADNPDTNLGISAHYSDLRNRQRAEQYPDTNLGISAHYSDLRNRQRAEQYRTYGPRFQIPCPYRRVANH